MDIKTITPGMKHSLQFEPTQYCADLVVNCELRLWLRYRRPASMVLLPFSSGFADVTVRTTASHLSMDRLSHVAVRDPLHSKRRGNPNPQKDSEDAKDSFRVGENRAERRSLTWSIGAKQHSAETSDASTEIS